MSWPEQFNTDKRCVCDACAEIGYLAGGCRRDEFKDWRHWALDQKNTWIKYHLCPECSKALSKVVKYLEEYVEGTY